MKLEKITKLLDPYLPQDLALKALKKVDPKISKFIGKATAAGFATEAILDFVRDRMSGSETLERTERSDIGAAKTTQKNQKQAENLIKTGVALAAPMAMAGRGAQATGAVAGDLMMGESEEDIPGIGYEDQQLLEYQEPESEGMQGPRMIEGEERKQLEYNPEGFGEPSGEPLMKGSTELFRFIDSLVQQGQPPKFAAERAKRDKRFTGNIQQIEAQFQMTFPDYIESMYQEQMTKGSPNQRGQRARQEQEDLRRQQQPKRRAPRQDPRQMDLFEGQQRPQSDARSQYMQLAQQNQEALNQLLKRLNK